MLLLLGSVRVCLNYQDDLAVFDRFNAWLMALY
jgi:hypothetical protein